MGSKTDEIIEELFESLLQRYQEELEKPMRRSEFILLVLMYCITFLVS